MALREYGVGDRGTPLVLLHGLGESGLCFERLVAEPVLADQRVLVPDLPGYGRTPWPETPLSLEAMADLVSAWLRSRGERSVVLVGHSMGGVVGLLIAERHPELVRTLVNIDGNVSRKDCGYSSRVVEMTEGQFEDIGFERLRIEILGEGKDDSAVLGYWASLRLADPRSFYRHACELMELSADGRLATRLGAVGAPVTYVAGSPGGACRESLELLERAAVPVVRIARAGHWPFIDRPQHVAELLADIVTRSQNS